MARRMTPPKKLVAGSGANSHSPDTDSQTTAASAQAASGSEGARPLGLAFGDTVRQHVGSTVVGQEQVVERVLIALLTGGHVLLEGVPGVAKTLLVQSIAKAIDLQFSRVQFTIDLLPSDIVGSEVLDTKSSKFKVKRGPLFTNLLLADEINRASPKVQSALLEAMQERRVTIGEQTFDLPAPFLVIATQNPVEQAGTFELPEAQMDRFLLRHRLGYPAQTDELEVLRRHLALGLKKSGSGAVPMSAFDAISETAPLDLDDLTRAMAQVQEVHVSEVFLHHTVELVRATRECSELVLGASPRAGLALTTAARARAWIHGRDFVVPEDLFELAQDVILHRIRPTYEALARGRSSEAILADLVAGLD